MSVGLNLLSAITIGTVEEYLKLKLKPEYFKPSEKDIYLFIDGFVQKYGSLPSQDLLFEHVGMETMAQATAPPAFYKDQVMDRFVTDSIKLIMTDTKKVILEQSPTDALNYIANQVISLHTSANDTQMVDFRTAAQVIKDHYVKMNKADGDHGIMMGWDSLDSMTNGLVGGDMVSYIGRPATGKTFQMLYSAHYAWYTQKKRVLVISMEMSPELLIQRLAAMHTHYGLTKLKTGNMSNKGLAKVLSSLVELTSFDEPLWIVHGNLTATVEDIWRLCRQLKPDAVYVDGAYLVKTVTKTQNKWDRIGYVAEEMKSAISTDIGIPSISSYQFSKDAVKQKKGEKPGLEHIYGSDVIAQVSSIVLGLFENDSVETIQRREVEVLKGRGGEIGKFFINWDFQYMNFNEYKEPALEQLQFL
jgi:replicative DNA helicase